MDYLFEMLATNGIFAVLFFFLLIFEIRDSRARESRYQCVIERLTEELHVVGEIDENVDEVLVRLVELKKEKVDEEK